MRASTLSHSQFLALNTANKKVSSPLKSNFKVKRSKIDSAQKVISSFKSPTQSTDKRLENKIAYVKPQDQDWSEMSVGERIEVVTMGALFGLPYAGYKGSKYAAKMLIEKAVYLSEQIPLLLEWAMDKFKDLIHQSLESIFKICLYIQDNTLFPLYEKILNFISILKDQAEKFLTWTKTNVLLPVAHAIKSLAQFIYDIVNLCLEKSSQGIKYSLEKTSQLLCWTHKHLLKGIEMLQSFFCLLGEGVLKALEWSAEKVQEGFLWTCKHLLIPLKEHLLKGIEMLQSFFCQLGEGALKALEWSAEKVQEGFLWTYKHLIIPIWKTIQKGFEFILISSEKLVCCLYQGLTALRGKVNEVTKWALERLLFPSLDIAKQLFSSFLDRLTFLLKKLYSSLIFAGGMIKDNAIWAYQNIFKPIIKLISLLLRTFWKGIQALGKYIKGGFLGLYNNILTPFFVESVKMMAFIHEKICKTIRFVASKALEPSDWAYLNILVPFAHAVSSFCLLVFQFLVTVKNKILDTTKLSYGYISDFGNCLVDTTAAAVISIQNNFLIPVYKRAFVLLDRVQQHIVSPAFVKVDYFVRDYILKILNQAQSVAIHALDRVKVSFWRSIDAGQSAATNAIDRARTSASRSIDFFSRFYRVSS